MHIATLQVQNLGNPHCPGPLDVGRHHAYISKVEGPESFYITQRWLQKASACASGWGFTVELKG